MKQRGFAPTLILVLIALAVLGYFGYKNYWPKQQTLATPTPIAIATPPTSDPWAGWKTLNNSAGNFSLRYPGTYKAIGSGINVDETTANEVYITQNSDDSKSNLPVIHIDAIDKKDTVYKDTSLKDIVQADFDANKANKNILIEMIREIESTSFAGEPAYTFEMNSNGFSGKWHGFMDYKGIDEVLEFEHNGIHFIIVYAKSPELVQILSTFKFIDATTSKVSECLAATTCRGGAPCMANPASVFCVCMGGEEKITSSGAGQSGVCKIDGKEYDEWEYFRSFSPS